MLRSCVLGHLSYCILGSMTFFTAGVCFNMCTVIIQLLHKFVQKCVPKAGIPARCWGNTNTRNTNFACVVCGKICKQRITARSHKRCSKGRNKVQGQRRGTLLGEFWVGFQEEVIIYGLKKE